MNPFSPSSTDPSIVLGADPKNYHSLGQSEKRGSPKFLMSRSELMRFNKNPWKWFKGAKQEVTNEMDWGSLLDCMVTTPHLLKELFDIYPETYPSSDKKPEPKPWNLNSNYCKAWRDERLAKGVTPIYMDVYEGARQACARLMEDPHISRLIEVSQRQVMLNVEYRDKETGIVVPFKCLLDLMPSDNDEEYGRFLADIKTTGDASPWKWERTIFDQSYHIQAACYIDALNAARGDDHYSGFLHAICEQDEPYAVGKRILSDEWLEEGRKVYQTALKRYCQCLSTGTWAGYDDEDNVPGSPLLQGWRLSSPQSFMIS